MAQALAWVLPFSAHGGLKDLKKRSIGRTEDLAIYARWLAPILGGLVSTAMVAKTRRNNRFPAVPQTSRKEMIRNPGQSLGYVSSALRAATEGSDVPNL